MCEKRTSEIKKAHVQGQHTLVKTVQISRRCAPKRTSEINKAHAQCLKALVITVQLARRCSVQEFSYFAVCKACVNSDTVLCYRPFVAPLFVAPGEVQSRVPWFLDLPKNCIASKCTFSFVNMTVFKSYLDLHLSESDWSRFVVRFWLSYLN